MVKEGEGEREKKRHLKKVYEKWKKDKRHRHESIMT